MKVLSFDRQRCTGDHSCEATCAQTWFRSDSPNRSSIRIREEDGGFQATSCTQCGECIEVCPTNALYRDPQGIVRLRKQACVGCMTCVGFCPHLAMFYNAKEAVPFKCVACGQCVKGCPAQALQIAEGDDPATLVRLSRV